MGNIAIDEKTSQYSSGNGSKFYYIEIFSKKLKHKDW